MRWSALPTLHVHAWMAQVKRALAAVERKRSCTALGIAIVALPTTFISLVHGHGINLLQFMLMKWGTHLLTLLLKLCEIIIFMRRPFAWLFPSLQGMQKYKECEYIMHRISIKTDGQQSWLIKINLMKIQITKQNNSPTVCPGCWSQLYVIHYFKFEVILTVMWLLLSRPLKQIFAKWPLAF